MRGKKGRQGRLGRGERRELDERTACKFKEVARGVRGANLLEDLGTVGWVGRHEGGANGVALAVASYAGTTRVRSGVFLGGSTTHDDADDATKKSVALPEGRGGVGGGPFLVCGGRVVCCSVPGGGDVASSPAEAAVPTLTN